MKKLILGREHVDATGAVDPEIMLAQLGEVLAALGYPAPYRGGADENALEFRSLYVHNDGVSNRFFSPPLAGEDPTNLDGVGTGYEEYTFPGILYVQGDGILIAGDTISTRIGVGLDYDGTGALYATGSFSLTGGDGIDVTGSTVSVDFEPTGIRMTTGPPVQLEVIPHTAAPGIEILGHAIGTILSTTGGLEYVGAGVNQIAVDTGDGIEIVGNDLSVNLKASGGLAFDAGELYVTSSAAGDTKTFYNLVRGTVTSPTSIDGKNDATFTLTVLAVEDSFTVLVPTSQSPNPSPSTAPTVGVTITVENDPPIRTTAGDMVYARYNHATERWTTDSLFNHLPQYIRIKGQAIGAVDAGDATFTIDNIEAVAGDDPRSNESSTTETITLVNDPPIVVGNNDTVYGMFDKTAANDWTTADAGNFLAMLKGIGSYDSTKKMAIWIDQTDDPEWKELTSEKVVEDYDHPNKEFDTKYVTVFETDTTGTTSITTTTCP